VLLQATLGAAVRDPGTTLAGAFVSAAGARFISVGDVNSIISSGASTTKDTSIEETVEVERLRAGKMHRFSYMLL